MKDLMQFYIDCTQILAELNITPGTILKIETSTRMTKSLDITYKRGDSFLIRISEEALADDVPDTSTQNVILHELLHTVPHCFNHGRQFQQYAKTINRAYPQLHISTYANPNDFNLPIEMTKKGKKKKEYRYRCKRCDRYIVFYKKTDFVKNHKNYRCLCGGKFKRIKDETEKG